MKICSTCKIEKDFTEFSKNKTKKDGLCHQCKSCVSIANKLYFQKNKDKIKENCKKYYNENKEKFSIKNKQYYEENKESLLIYAKEYRIKNRDKILDKLNQYYIDNIDSFKEYYLKNKDNSAKLASLKRAAKKRAKPRWLTTEQLEEIKDFYTACKMFQIYTGLTYHVDHIIPLQGETVCGLHVPWNLQILEASENISKKNKLLEKYSN